ncbi:MAG: hypothetical protein ABI841_02510 [Chloroflexota bacterium]
MTAGHEPRPLWPMLLIGALLLVVVLVIAAVAFAGLPQLGPRETPAPAAPSGNAVPTGSGAGDDAVVDASSFSWASALMLPPPAGRPMPIAYSLQGGTLGDPARPLEVVVAFAVTDALADLGRIPAIGEPTNGAVVYAADDGRLSQIRRATLSDPVSDELILELEAVVWTLTVTPDGSHAYVLLVGRGQPGDAGVLRVALDGSGQVEEVMGPARAAAGEGEFRLVAIAGLRTALALSPDERFLLRRVCAAAVQACAVDVLDVESGEVLALPDRDVLGVAGEMVLATACDMVGCHLTVILLGTGEERLVGPLNGQAVMATVEGSPVVVHNSSPGEPDASSLHVTDPLTGDTIQLLDGGAGGFVELHSNLYVTTKVAGPPGWVVATVWDPQGRGQGVAVDLSDGTTILLPIAPGAAPVMPPMGGVNG